ncbi:MAG: thiol reductant ABC exporter subunit CydD [Coriobacteriia bacterium]|nr:thiol reductant ABC exporter subunit CydD [Coriobacteriia bacterium]
MFALLLAFAVLDAALIVIQALCLSGALVHLWEGAVAGRADGLLAGALPGALGFAAAFVLRNAVDALRGRLMDGFSRTRAAELRSDLLTATYEQGSAGVQARGSAVAVDSLIGGVDNVRNYVGIILPKVADLMAIPTVLTVALFLVDWVSGVIALVILPCIIGYMQLLGAHAKAQAAAQHEEYDRLANHFMDTLRGLLVLKAFGRSRPYAKQVFAVSEGFREATVKTLRTATLSSLVLDLFRTFALAAVAIMLGFRLLNGTAELFAALAVLIMVPEYFAAVRRYSTDFHASLDGRNSLAAILAVVGESAAGAVGDLDAGADATAGGDEAVDADVAASAADDEAAAALSPWSAGSVLELEGVGFRYPGEPAPALQDVSVRIAGPCKVGLVGVSGSGKSTLARLLAGFSAPTAGRILVNGRPVDSLGRPDWLGQVTFIPQNPHVFSASLRDNVAFYVPDATDDQVAQAVELAGLSPIVEKLPEGLDTRVGQGGRALSGGQAQRVALARAFLDDRRRVLVFDEPTAHLDIQTELALKERMLPLMEGRLVLFATHRLHWLRDMDLVLVLRDGRVVEWGTPDELLVADGALRELVRDLRGGEQS